MPRFKSADGLDLHYTDEGRGLPLLALPGLTRTGRDFRYLQPHLPDLRFLTLDMRGRGGSDWDPNWENYNVTVECRDIVDFMDHRGLERVAILGTSRGGLQAMALATTIKHRIKGVALNDVGPVLAPAGLAAIMTYLGVPPKAKTFEEAATALAKAAFGFSGVPHARWLEEAQTHFQATDGGLALTYDPKLRDAVAATTDVPDLWPLFEALADLPLCLIRGANSTLLSPETAARMKARRPDMILAEIPERGHVPFLDEPGSLAALRAWLEVMA